MVVAPIRVVNDVAARGRVVMVVMAEGVGSGPAHDILLGA